MLNGKLDFSRKTADSVHLSDLERDQGERTNLAGEYPDLARQMEDDVRAWFAGLKEEAAK